MLSNTSLTDEQVKAVQSFLGDRRLYVKIIVISKGIIPASVHIVGDKKVVCKIISDTKTEDDKILRNTDTMGRASFQGPTVR